MDLLINAIENMRTVVVMPPVAFWCARCPPESESRRSDVFTVIVLCEVSLLSPNTIVNERAHIYETGHNAFVLHS